MEKDKKSISSNSANATADNEIKLKLLYEIGRILASTETMKVAAPQILEAICQNLQYEIGELWLLDKELLKLKSFWHLPSKKLEQFVSESQLLEFSAGIGLPGMVWGQNAPVWIENISAANGLSRQAIAGRAGMKSAFAFPVMLGEKFLGAFCFFCEKQCPHDEALMQIFTFIGGNIGQFIKRERSERSLRESEENFRAFVQASSQAIWTTDSEGQRLEAFGWWEKQTGQTREESFGEGFLKAVHPEDRRQVREVWHKAISNTEFFETECRIVNLNNEYQYFAIRGVPVFNTDEGFRQWIGTLTDITNRKVAEQSLKDSEERYRALVEATSTVVWRSTPDGELSFVGSFWETVSGQRIEEILGSGWLNAIHPDDREETIKTWQHSLATKNIYETEFRVLTTGGEYRWFAVRGVPILDAEGKVREWVGANTDIHERKLAEEKVRESEERFRNMADNAPVMVWVTDATGYCNYLSQSWYDFTGRTPETGLGFGWLDATHPDDLKMAETVFFDANEKHKAFRVEYRLRGANGNYIWAIDSAQPRFDQDGKFLGHIGSVIDISERKAMEESLRESESRYRTLFETMDEGFCLCEMIFDADGKPSDYRFLEINPVFEVMTGLRDVIGKTVRELLPNLESHWFETYGRVVSTGESIRFTDGSEAMNRWFDVYASRVGGADSRKFSLLFNNITERIAAELALKESQQHLALALKIGRAGTFEWDIKNNINRWSPEIEAMYGVPTGTFEGNFEGWRKRVVSEDGEKVEQGIQRALKEKANDFEYEFRVILPDNSQNWFAGRARFDYDENREPTRMIGINVDITERKLTEIALSDARARLESTLTAGEIGTWVWDVVNDAVFADKNLAKMFEVSETDANGGKIENYIRAIHSEDRERVSNIIAQAIESGDEYEADYRLVSRKGDICWVVARGTIERDASGKPVSLPGVVLDITGRKEAESEREQLFIEAQKARETAEQANRSKDEFIALVSHELRSPLNAMLGWTRILQKKQADEKTSEYALDVIVRNALSQSRLIEDLLDIARIGEGKLRLEMRPTEIVPIIKAAIEIIKPAADAKKIYITESLDSSANFVSGDDDRLRQIVENLLSNAVKFTPEGGKVKVSLKRQENKAQIIISDNGQGITAEFLPQIFERFKQADPSTTRRHGGLGIGLSLARDLVELHGGKISAQSEGEGTGATFIVTLPLRMIMPIKQNSDAEENMSSQGKLNGFWILAVDDEADAREIVSFMLQINGAKVTTANSAVEALEILKGANGRIPDILLSDISMPFESGYALLQKIRALPRESGGQIPAVALTAFNRPEDREAAFEAGFQRHLGKPVDMDALIDAIVETAGAKHI